ncbi:SAM-dependent methyltransferase [Streptomyces uncialis]|uniref:SAM-dependent methyltransferase n=1 Tax=Streptomyces uncialis TaxID=1048205 RepID=UPI002E3397CD|nr:SAM-dependent methyltransferase [Streptomyces uncialis]
MTDPTPARRAPTGVDTSVPHSARIWNFWQGGEYFYEADRIAGEAFAAEVPEIRELALSSRQFLRRTVRWALAGAGLRQVLDLGAGLPSAPDVHEIARAVDPLCRVVYVDNDPMVTAHRVSGPDSAPDDATAYVHADVRDTAHVLAEAARVLDLGRPTALVLSDMLGHISDLDEAYGVVERLVGAVAPGSLLVLSHSAPSSLLPRLTAANDAYAGSGGTPYVLRTPEQIAGFFEGLELVPPGLVPMPRWRPDGSTLRSTADVGWGAVARIG